MHENALIIFIKNPVRGQVKTRLASEIGEQKALQIYHQLLAHTRQTATKLSVDRYLFYSDQINLNDNWPSGLFHKVLQQGSNLGEKMKNAFAEVCPSHVKVVIIGSDCPSLKTKHINTAFHQLDENDVVIGPANDGGYYLLGMKQFLPFVFDQKTWSSPQLLQETQNELIRLGYRYALLEELTDIDTKDDLEKENMDWRADK